MNCDDAGVTVVRSRDLVNAFSMRGPGSQESQSFTEYLGKGHMLLFC